MTEEDVQLLEALPHVEPEEKPKTKLEQFIEELSKYPDAETAKQHIAEIAEKLKCAKSLGYKALKRIETFQPQQPQAIEPTVKIPEAKPEEIPEEIIAEEAVEEAQPTQEAPQPEAIPAPQIGVGFKPEDVTWMFDKGFKTIADLTGYGSFALNKDEAQKLGEMWTPIINANLPQLLPHAPIISATITTLIIIAPRVKGYWTFRRQKQQEKPIEQPKQEPPKNERGSEGEQPKPETPKNPPELPKTAGFMKALMESG
jgi:hypothetical protein